MTVYTRTLWDLSPHNAARIVEIQPHAEESYRNRLNDLGFLVGEAVTCVRRTPFQGPRVFKIGDSIFSLDRETALTVVVTGISEA